MPEIDYFTARACASLEKLIFWVSLHHGKEFIFLKGLRVSDEITDAQKQFLFSYEILPQRGDKCLVKGQLHLS